jgi:glycolate oxidase FAD binding subunit
MDVQLLNLREQVLVARQAHAPLVLRGAGTKDFYGACAPAGATLELRDYQGIIDYEPSELMLRARCGTPLSQIDATLAAQNQFLGFEPPAFGADPTLGGIIASGLSGPRRLAVGAARDFVLGASLMVSDGEVLQFGGQVMKNVAGFDVARLLCGSLGIFGILTEISLKVLPRPRAEQTVRLEMSAAQAISSFNRWGGRPLPISAAAWHEGAAWVRLSGAESAVLSAREEIGGDPVFEKIATRWWDALRHQSHPVFSEPRLWRLSVPQSAPHLQLRGEPLIDWGGAVRWYAGENEDENEVRRVAASVGGTAACWRGKVAQGRFHPLAPGIAAIHRRLKSSFDPDGLFNRGRLVADL